MPRRDPDALVIGIDADAASMRDASRKAARVVAKGGLPNAIFVVSAVESLPDELAGVADEVRITFPWGALLRGVLGLDGTALGGIAHVAKPGAEIRAHLDHRSGCPRRCARQRIDVARSCLEEERASSPRDPTCKVRRDRHANSSWAKRLGAGVDRPATLLRLVRA